MDDEQLRKTAQLLPKYKKSGLGKRGEIYIPNFTEKEVIATGMGIKPKRAAVADGIPPEAIKLMAKSYPKEMVEMMSGLLRDGTFLTNLKRES